MKTGFILIIIGIVVGAAGGIAMTGSMPLADLYAPQGYSSVSGVIKAFGLGAVIAGGGLGLVGLIRIGIDIWRMHY